MSQRQESLRSAVPKFGAIVGRFGPQIRRQRGLIAASAFALVAEVVVRLLEPWPLKLVLDHVIVDGRSGGPDQGLGAFDRIDDGTLIALLAAAVVVFAAMRAALAYASTIGLAIAGSRALNEVRALVYRHIHRLPLAWHHRARSGDLMTRLTNDIGRLQDVVATAVVPLTVNCLTLVGILGVMLVLNWQLALLSVAVFPLFALSTVRRVGDIRGAARKARRRDGAMASLASESLTSMKVVQALSLEDTLEEGFARQSDASLKEGMKGKRLTAGLERRVDVVVAVGTALVLGYGAHLVQSGQITPGDLVLFVTYLKTAFRPVRDMAKYTGRLAQAAASGERILDVLDTVPEIRDRPGARPLDDVAGRVRFAGVSLAYEPGHPVLRDVDLEVLPGQRVALVGPSGGGKSTLVSLLPRLYDVDDGRVLIDGHDVRDVTLESLRRQIGIVLQESVLFAVSVRENIGYGRPGATQAEIEEAARLANAHEFIERLPEGYDTVVGERGATLSGGQRQRIAIARAALRNAPIMVYDEPTVGLDRHNARAVDAALRDLAEGRTTFWVTHALETVHDADVIAWVEDGRVVEHGTHEELVALGGRYARAYSLRSEVAEPDDGEGWPSAPLTLGEWQGLAPE